MMWDEGLEIGPNAGVNSGLGQKLTEVFFGQLGGEMHPDSTSTGLTYRSRVPRVRVGAQLNRPVKTTWFSAIAAPLAHRLSLEGRWLPSCPPIASKGG